MSDQVTNQIAQLMDANDAVMALDRAADGQAMATWATKSGKERAAYTVRALQDAPATVRKGDAFAQVVAQLKNGLYISFCKDADAALTKAHRRELQRRLAASVEVKVIDGVEYLPAVATTLDHAKGMNKARFAVVAQFLARPQVSVKNVITDKPLGKTKQWISEAAAAWLAAQK